ELAESEDVVVHLLEQPALLDHGSPDRAVVLIGRELEEAADGRSSFSLVTAQYTVAGATGTVGLIGPTRMQYARAVALVEHVAGLLSASGE
ncbi:MAG: heat-inducible transcription repressor HrcA, partial [Rubricoccaceae bacterium]|nr:heat-inducible transcription repressor HrcA [Rubricoccaceae bacterium]